MQQLGAPLEALIEDIKEILDSKKATDIEAIDLRDSGYFVDFVVIATASIGKQALALLHYLREGLAPKGIKFYSVDDESEDWIVIDIGDVIVHIFTENQRRKYNLEEFLQSSFCKKAKASAHEGE